MKLWIFFVAVFVVSCASSDIHRGEIKEKRLHDGFRETLVLKWFRWTRSLNEKQESKFPGFAVGVPESGVRYIVALSLSGQDSFWVQDVRWLQGDVKATRVQEVSDRRFVRQAFSFAYPYYRVFVIDFPRDDVPFDVLTPVGALQGLR